MRWLIALALLFAGLNSAAYAASATPVSLAACAPALDAGACITPLIATGGEYTCGQGYSYTVKTPIAVTAANTSLSGGCTFVLGAADIYLIDATAAGFQLSGVKLTNPSGFGQTNTGVFTTSVAVMIRGKTPGYRVTGNDIEGFVVGVMRQGWGPPQPQGGGLIESNRISVLPWNMHGATWANDAITVYNGNVGDVVSNNTVVIYSGPGIFDNFATAYTYARCGVIADATSQGVIFTGNVVGKGFATTGCNDGPGVKFDTNTLYAGFNSTLALANGSAVNNIIAAPTSTGGGIYNATVTITGGGSLTGNAIAGASSAVPLVMVQNVNPGAPINAAFNRFSGTYSKGFDGIVPGGFTSTGETWAGTTPGSLYGFSGSLASYSAGGSIQGDVTASGASYQSAFAVNAVQNFTLTGNNWPYAWGGAIVLIGDTSNITVSANNIPGAAGGVGVWATLAAGTRPLVVTGNNLAGYTTAVNVDAAHAGNTVTSGNFNNTVGTH